MKFTKILLCSLCLLLCFSSCTLINRVKQETEKTVAFTGDFVQLVEEPSVEKAEELLHPQSNLSPETVLEKIQGNDKLANLDFSQEITVGEISDVKILPQDAELGGNVYSIDCQILVGDTPINVSLTILSTEDGFGLYDFEIK